MIVQIGRPRIRQWAGLLLLGAVTFVVVGYIFSAHNRDSASTLISALLSVTTAATGVAMWLWASPRRIANKPLRSLLERAAAELAEQVRLQWEQAASERRLTYPMSIRLQWQWSHRQVTGPAKEAVCGDPAPPSWQCLIEYLRAHPDRVLAQAWKLHSWWPWFATLTVPRRPGR